MPFRKRKKARKADQKAKLQVNPTEGEKIKLKTSPELKNFREYINRTESSSPRKKDEAANGMDSRRSLGLRRRGSSSVGNGILVLRKSSSGMLKAVGNAMRRSLGRSKGTGGSSDPLRVMFLGVDGSGKTTLYRQMLRIAGNDRTAVLETEYSPTKSMVSEKIQFQRQMFEFYDIGGNSKDRVQWMHHLEDMNAIFFVVSLESYDEQKDGSENHLYQSLEVFDAVKRTVDINDGQMVLILNKDDGFRQKLCEQKIKLNASTLFPDAPDTTDYDEALEWIKQKFRDRAGENWQRLKIFVTSATDDNAVHKTMKEAAVGVIRRNKAMKWSSLL